MKYEHRLATSDSCSLIDLCTDLLRPKSRKSDNVEFETKPRQPTSNGRTCSCQWFASASSTRSAYLAALRSCATSSLSSFGQVSSKTKHTRRDGEYSRMSGRLDVEAISGGNTW